MKVKEEIRFGLWIVLVFASMLFLSRYSAIYHHEIVNTPCSDRIIVPEIQEAPVQYDLSIENSGSGSGVSPSCRFSMVLVFPNRLAELKFNRMVPRIFMEEMLLLIPVPIFIRGHAFLN